MNAVFAIAANTVREAVRDRVLWLLLFFAVIVIIGSEGLAVLAVGDPVKVTLDLGLASISFFGVLIAVFLGLSMVAKEIQRRTVHTVVSKPISRASFVLGKYLGLYATVLLLTVAMTVVFSLFVHLRYDAFRIELVYAVVLFLAESLVLAAFAVLFSCFTTPILGTLFTVTIYVIGHLTFGLKILAGYDSMRDTLGQKLILAVYYLLPNLERFNIKAEVVHGDPLAEGLLLPVLYGVLYAAAVLLVATEVFRRRDFV